MQRTGSPWAWTGGDVEVELAALQRLAGSPLSQQDQRSRPEPKRPPSQGRLQGSGQHRSGKTVSVFETTIRVLVSEMTRSSVPL